MPGALEPSITFASLPLLPVTPSCSPLTPSCSPLAPLLPLLPSCSPHSLSPPLTPLIPSRSLLPLALTEVAGTSKHSIANPYPTLALAPTHSPHPLSLPGPLGPSWGLRKPWEPLEFFGSLGSSVRLRSLAPLAPPTPSLSLAPLCPPHLPGTFPGPQEALGAFGSLQQPWVFSQAQGHCSACSPSPPSLPLTPLIPWASLGP